MSKFSKIMGVVAVLGVSGIVAVFNLVGDVVSGKPIETIVSNVVESDFVQDKAKSKASDILFGSEDTIDNLSSLSGLFSKSKYSAVSDKGSSIIHYWSSSWYSEVYRVDSTAYIGNRRFNKPTGANFGWSMKNGSDFEIATYKKGVANKNSYIAYDSDTFTLTIGELKKYKFNGYVLVYDEYNQVYKLVEYKKGKETGYSLVYDEDGLNYYKSDKNVGYFDTDNNTLVMNNNTSIIPIAEAKLDISYSDYTYTFEQNGNTLVIDTINDYITYDSDYCSFSGNAFQNECTYNIDLDKESWVKYSFTTLSNLVIECSDGSYGEVIMVDSSAESDEAKFIEDISNALVTFGVKELTSRIVDAGFDAIPELNTLDSICGGYISDTIKDTVDDTLDSDDDSSITDKLDNTYDNLTDEDDYHSLVDKIKDGLGIESYEDQKSKGGSMTPQFDEDGNEITE